MPGFPFKTRRGGRFALPALALCAAALLALPGCRRDPDAAFVDARIAGLYEEFYNAGPTNPAAAREALGKLRDADPDNAYTHYLKASLAAQTGDLAGALEAIQKGNSLKKAVIYVSAPPPDDSMQTLTRVRQLGFTADRSGALGDKQLEYIRAVRAMGRRILEAEPVCSLSVVNGAGIVRKSYQSELAYWKAKKQKAEADRARKKLEEVERWYDGFNRKLAQELGDLVREAGKAAGLSEKELELYARGIELEDGAKQERADAAKKALYAKEVAALREAIRTFPDVSR